MMKSKGYKFDAANHVHTLDGKRLYGVTTILKSWGDPGALVNWAANQAVDYIHNKFNKEKNLLKLTEITEQARTAHLRKRDKAGDVGTKVHNELEEALNAWIAGNVVNHMNPIVQSVLDWMRENEITPIATEVNVYSREHWYGGIFDAVIEKDGQRYILDFKTSGTVQTKYFYQCGAYSLAVKEMKKEAKIAGVCIVHIPRGKSFNPDKNVYWRKDIVALENAFINILNTFKLDKDLQKLVTPWANKKTSIKI